MKKNGQKPRAAGESLPPAGTGWPEDAASIGAGEDILPEDELGKGIAAIRALHPELPTMFHQSDHSALDEQAKGCLMEEMRAALGVKPLNCQNL